MTNFPNRGKETGFETTLSTPINSTTTTVVLSSGPTYTSGGEVTRFTILNPKGIEVISATGWTSGTLSGVTRGVALYTGAGSSARAHPAGTRVVIGNVWQYYDDINTGLDSKVDVAGDTMTGLLQWSGTTHVGLQVVSLTTTQRDAASPSNGSIIYNTTTGEFQIYQGGAWSTVASGSTQPNASTTVAGKVEIATETEVNAGTDAGGTLADLVVGPPELAAVIQDQGFSFAADAQANDTYVITLTPAPDAYVTGQRFTFTANTANTGGATLNVNSLGAKTLVKGDDTALATGDIAAGQVVEVVYDGTNMVMTSLPENLVDGTDAKDNHFHSAIDFVRLSSKDVISIDRAALTAASGDIDDQESRLRVNTQAANNATGIISIALHSAKNTTLDVSSSSPEFYVAAAYESATAQEGFIGFVANAFTGTSLENAVMTLDHVGFIIQDGTISISVADGTTQSVTSVSGTVTDTNTYRMTFDGTTATFYINDSSVGTRTANIPNSNLEQFICAVVADATAAQKAMGVKVTGAISYNKLTA